MAAASCLKSLARGDRWLRDRSSGWEALACAACPPELIGPFAGLDANSQGLAHWPARSLTRQGFAPTLAAQRLPFAWPQIEHYRGAIGILQQNEICESLLQRVNDVGGIQACRVHCSAPSRFVLACWRAAMALAASSRAFVSSDRSHSAKGASRRGPAGRSRPEKSVPSWYSTVSMDCRVLRTVAGILGRGARGTSFALASVRLEISACVGRSWCLANHRVSFCFQAWVRERGAPVRQPRHSGDPYRQKGSGAGPHEVYADHGARLSLTLQPCNIFPIFSIGVRAGDFGGVFFSPTAAGASSCTAAAAEAFFAPIS